MGSACTNYLPRLRLMIKRLAIIQIRFEFGNVGFKGGENPSTRRKTSQSKDPGAFHVSHKLKMCQEFRSSAVTKRPLNRLHQENVTPNALVVDYKSYRGGEIQDIWGSQQFI